MVVRITKKTIIRKLRLYVVIYMVLFILIGPKIFLISVVLENMDRATGYDEIYSLVSGHHTDDTIKFCFNGRVRGVVGKFQYENSIEFLDGEDSTESTPIRILSKDLELGCEIGKNANNMNEFLLVVESRLVGIANKSQNLMKALQNGYAVLVFYSVVGDSENRDKNSFALLVPSAEHDKEYLFNLVGQLRQEIDYPISTLLIAILKDLVTWPYQLVLLITDFNP